MAKKQILLVEGDIANAERLKQNLEAEEYNVDVVYQGQEAIMLLNRKWVDLIISSITLQDGMNGIQFLQEIKNHQDFKKIPVIIQTGKVNMEKMVSHMGIKLFVAKPYNMPDFIQKIKEVLNS